MAPDLKKPLNLKALQGKEEWPTKTDINLATDPTEKAQNSPMTILLFIIVLILIVIFAKFGVIDVLSQASSANSKIADVQKQETAMTQAMADYDDVKAQYESIASNAYTTDEATYLNRSAVLDLLEADLPNIDNLKSAVLQGNTMVLVFNDVSLTGASSTVAALESNPHVSTVTVSSAVGVTDVATATSVTVNFLPNGTVK